MDNTMKFIVCGREQRQRQQLISGLLTSPQDPAKIQILGRADSSISGSDPDKEVRRGNESETITTQGECVSRNRRLSLIDSLDMAANASQIATGALAADLAIVMVDCLSGAQAEVQRCARLVSLTGIRHLALAVDGMEKVSWSKEAFDGVVSQLIPSISALGFASVHTIPISTAEGDNIVELSERMPWYDGPCLLTVLVEVDVREPEQSFRMAVESGKNSNNEYPGFSGCIASGVVRPGDRVRVVPGGSEATVKSVFVGSEELPEAGAGRSVTLCLDGKAEAERGSVLSSASAPISQSDQFEAKVLCLSQHPLIPGRSYVLKLHTSESIATITSIKYLVDLLHGQHLAAKKLEKNDLGVVNISTDSLIPFEPFNQCRSLGSFFLVDAQTGETVGAGMIDFSLRRAANIHWQAFKVDKAVRAHQKVQSPACIWLTGLSGSGKSTIANLLEQHLVAADKHTYVLDGDNVRHGLNRDLGFTEADRVENLRRVTEVARLFVDAGLIVVVAFISPYCSERDRARSRFENGEFFEVFVDTPIEECEKRDTKGLYAKARRGELKNFTGVDSPYEPPLSPEIHLHTIRESAEECAERILQMLKVEEPAMQA